MIEKTRIAFLGLTMFLPTAWAASELPDDSIYHVGSYWLNQNSERMNIDEFRGMVQVVAFVYTYCEHSCPLILANLKRIEEKIPAKRSPEVRFSLVSLDPARDSPEVLKRYMLEHDLDERLWTMLNGDPDDVLELSALIGVRYRPMDSDTQDIAHSNMITVLDRQGRIHYQMKGLNEGLDPVVSAIMRTIKATN